MVNSAGGQAQNREVITLTGEPADIENALAAAFLAVPTVRRPRCTFDTYFYRCNLVATYFWAIGLPEPPPSFKFALVEAAARQVQGGSLGQPETAYERWVVAAIAANQVAELARQRDGAFALAEWLDGHDYDESLLEAAPPQLTEAVLQVNPEAVQARLRSRVGEQMPSALAQRVTDQLYRQMAVLDLYDQLRRGFARPPLLDALYDSYAAATFKEPSGEELKALEKILSETRHAMLGLFLAYWRNSHQRLAQALEQADEAAYRHFTETALRLKLVKPSSLLIQGRVDTFLELYLAVGVENLVDLVEALLEMDTPTALVRLISYVPSLSAKELKRLAALIKDQSSVPEPFQVAVQQALAALPTESGLTGKLQGLWRRVSGGE